MHEALLDKDNNNFWNIWNSKFGGSKSGTTVINGTSDSQQIADNFAIYFSQVYNDNDGMAVNFNSIFDKSFLNYVGNTSELIFDIATVDDVISKLKKAKLLV